MSKHLTAFTERHKKPSETIVTHVEGYIGDMMGKGEDTQHNGVLVVTGERVAFYRKGIFGEVLETIPLKGITSIERRSLLGRHAVELHTSHDSLHFKTFVKGGVEAICAAIDAGREPPAAAPAPAPAPAAAANGPLELLEKLGALKAAGILTDEEFEAKKAQLLAQI